MRETLLAALANHCLRPDWIKDGGQYIPLPATWLNGRCWEDEILSNTEQSNHVDLDKIDHTLGLERQPDGIPPRFRTATLENYRTDSKPEPQAVALRQCREYAERFDLHWQAGLSMMLLGEVGTGKTHLGCAVAQHVIRHHGAHARYTSALAIIRDVKATFSKTADSAKRVGNKYDMSEAKVREIIKTGVGWIDCSLERFIEAA